MYWFLGGDSRSLWAVEQFRQRGLTVHCHNVPGLPHEALPSHIPCLILPAPSFVKSKIPGCPELTLEELLNKLDADSRVYCMKVEALAQAAQERGAQVTDLYNSEPYTTRNALATAEGAIYLAMRHSPMTVRDSACLVIGAGRIGSLLSEKLSALGANVTLCARRPKDRALGEARGLDSDETGMYRKGLSHYDFLFNTVPAPVLTGSQLQQLKNGCVLVELASAPGGFDPAECDTLNLQVLSAPGLPGSYCPKSAGEYYASAILEKEGVL
ncbi:MAG: hypothetical protein IKT58_01470 [Oscillospiraceae bacterium]|nr:hypothetical protein [Oscillospiraceae bacterium]